MIISLIVAASLNNAIGKNNQLLWHLPNDMKFFKNTTWAMPVIMGRKTFESMNKPLPGRINIVITKQNDWQAEGVVVASDITDAIKKAKETNCKEAFIIGGGEIYNQTMGIASNIYMTRVFHSFEDADVFFPFINEAEWSLLQEEKCIADEKHLFDYSFQLWRRESNKK